jgi:hypothetical protein
MPPAWAAPAISVSAVPASKKRFIVLFPIITMLHKFYA